MKELFEMTGCDNLNIYSFLSPGYDILDITWFSDKGDNPRDIMKNCRFRCCDASETGIKDSSFDYIILGLVLHECNDRQWKDILCEAGRLLKDNGRLIVLEWDEQEKTGRKNTCGRCMINNTGS